MKDRMKATSSCFLDMLRVRKVVPTAESPFPRSTAPHLLEVKISQSIKLTKLLKIAIKSRMLSLINLNKGYWEFRSKLQKNMALKLLPMYRQVPFRMKLKLSIQQDSMTSKCFRNQFYS